MNLTDAVVLRRVEGVDDGGLSQPPEQEEEEVKRIYSA
jgi:hypothetical protein